MIDSFDYKDSSCSLCVGKEFYNPGPDLPEGRIPTGRIIDKLSSFFDKNDLDSAKRHLEYWKKEAVMLKDKKGELEMESELIGLYRKMQLEEEGLKSSERALELVYLLEQENTVTGATIILNSATNFRAFGKVEKSLPLYQKVLEVYDKKLDKKNSLFAGFYNNFALALSEVKNYEKAKEYFKMAIGVLESSNPLNPDIAVSLINLAHTDWEQNKNKENVTEYLFRANQILGDEKAEKNSHLALVLSKCAPSFEFFGFKKLAEDYKKISEEIYERS